MISASKTTSGNNLFIKDRNKKEAPLIQVTDNYESNSYISHNIGSKLYITTNLNAPNKRMITTDASNPQVENWKDFIEETDNVLSVSKGGGYFFAKYFIDANSKVLQYNYAGDFIREVAFSGQGNVSGFGGKEDQKDIFYRFSNYITPGSSFKYNVESGESTLYWSPDIDFDSENFVSEQHFSFNTTLSDLVGGMSFKNTKSFFSIDRIQCSFINFFSTPHPAAYWVVSHCPAWEKSFRVRAFL